MSELVRTAIGEFKIEDAIDVASITAEMIQKRLLPAIAALPQLSKLTVTDDEITKLGNGVAISNRRDVSGGEFAAVSTAGDLVAILAADQRGLRPIRYFPR
jgi:tRNA U55 pseudouridine synthase TruB